MQLHCARSETSLSSWSFQVQLLRIGYGCIVMILLYISAASGQNNFYQVRSCTDIRLRDIPEDVFQKCTEVDKVIHCVPNENDDLGLSCFPVTWIGPGRCPYYNSYQGNMDEKDCNATIGSCSKVHYKSPSSLLYKGCYAKENFPTTTATATTTEMKPTTRESMPRIYITNPSFENRTNCRSSKICEEYQCVAEIVILVLVCIVLLVVGGIFLKSKWNEISVKCKKGSKDPPNQESSNEAEKFPLE